MSNTKEEQITTTSEETPSVRPEITDLEPRKMNETFDTEDDDSSDSQHNDDNDNGAELQVQDAAVDILDQLVELFIERNGREPNEEEVMQWIGVFKSLQIEDNEEATAEGEEESSPASVNAAAE